MYIAIYPLPLVYGLYTCENVDNCERPLNENMHLDNFNQILDVYNDIINVIQDSLGCFVKQVSLKIQPLLNNPIEKKT